MVEFSSDPPKSTQPARFFIALGVLIIALGGIFMYVRYQRNTSPPSGATTVVVPGLLRAGDPDFEYYKTQVLIENVKATLAISFNQARIAIISGTIVNNGDRRLEALELHIVLYDVWGEVSKERTAFALRPGAGLSGKPMEPLERRSFTIGVESVEYYWDPKQVSYEITGLRYK
jgi:hypothetical protein